MKIGDGGGAVVGDDEEKLCNFELFLWSLNLWLVSSSTFGDLLCYMEGFYFSNHSLSLGII